MSKMNVESMLKTYLFYIYDHYYNTTHCGNLETTFLYLELKCENINTGSVKAQGKLAHAPQTLYVWNRP